MSSPFDLLDKKELRVTDVHLDGANLTDLARAVAEVLGLDPAEVLVTDYLDAVLTFDVLRPSLYPHQLLDRKNALLAHLAGTPGVRLGEHARVSADGVLGWIAADGADGVGVADALATAQRLATGMDARIARRVLIFSTGAEVAAAQIRDTNRETVATRLTEAGYACEFGGTIRDDVDLIAGTIRAAAGRGYGLVVTTGGVGAEAKDCTVEAVLRLDPGAATPYLFRVEPGHGRHLRDGVRVAVGSCLGSRIVCLPGPNDEVAAGLDAILPGLRDGWGNAELAEALAGRLRGRLRDRMAGS
ncbi:molybdopterin-binding protein [Cryptosporangium aurantiacum]|uniref:Molybdenum cofactor synthesis domain-containing protein n=1 Tax=Cryptosporangium aurantiacum TaxID=134849 RepID=A0A1M7PEY8_9ACTN|nr:molybdopterin-binding protein [Cryptosporangium aurantiacum]SHN15529.1 molybdenum cofactor synthesis domain-containing protein [Cryptosporangium aurantiacum]